jgi:hypothetical protein
LPVSLRYKSTKISWCIALVKVDWLGRKITKK